MPDRTPLDFRPLRVALAALALAACGESVGPAADGAILALDRNVDLQVTDTAIVVDGETRMGLGSARQGLLIYHSVSYEYGGLGSYAPDRVWEEQWFSRVGYELEPVMRGDTVVHEFLDLGTVTMQGEPLLEVTESPDVSGAPYPVEFVNFFRYLGTHYAWRLEPNGAEITFVASPYLPRLIAGDDITLNGTGGPSTGAFATTFATHPLPRLTGIDNGGRATHFTAERPVIDAGRGLGISFDGLVDPATAFFALFPWHEDVPDPARRRAATLVGQLLTPIDRAVIPGSVLGGMLDAAGVDEAGYVLYVIRALDTGDAFQVPRLDTSSDLTLGVGQRDDTRLFVRLVR